MRTDCVWFGIHHNFSLLSAFAASSGFAESFSEHHASRSQVPLSVCAQTVISIHKVLARSSRKQHDIHSPTTLRTRQLGHRRQILHPNMFSSSSLSHGVQKIKPSLGYILETFRGRLCMLYIFQASCPMATKIAHGISNNSCLAICNK